MLMEAEREATRRKEATRRAVADAVQRVRDRRSTEVKLRPSALPRSCQRHNSPTTTRILRRPHSDPASASWQEPRPCEDHSSKAKPAANISRHQVKKKKELKEKALRASVKAKKRRAKIIVARGATPSPPPSPPSPSTLLSPSGMKVSTLTHAVRTQLASLLAC